MIEHNWSSVETLDLTKEWNLEIHYNRTSVVWVDRTFHSAGSPVNDTLVYNQYWHPDYDWNFLHSNDDDDEVLVENTPMTSNSTDWFRKSMDDGNESIHG